MQLAHVAGPVLNLKEIQRFREDGGGIDIEFVGVSGEKVADEGGDVFGSIAQRGDGEGDDIEPVEEVRAEGPGLDHFFKVAMGGGNDADIDGNTGSGADALDLAFLQDAEELGLKGEGDVADFVEKERAIVGLLESSNAQLIGPGEGAFFVTEQFAFEEVVGNGGAVDGDEGAMGAVAVLIDGASDEFLACSGFSSNEDRDGFGGDASEFFVDLGHGPAFADDGVLVVVDLADLDGFGHHARAPDGLGENAKELFFVEWFSEVVVGAGFGRLDDSAGGAGIGEHDDGEAGVAGV